MSAAELKVKLVKTVERLRSEIASLRTGRASSALVENIEVDYYGTKTPLKALAAISVPGPKELLIQPWYKASLQPIEKAIRESELGLSPAVDKDLIRLTVPPLTEERRKELLKVLGRHVEDARIHVRREREETLKETDRKEKAKEISEDEKFRQKNEIQKAVDEANKKIEEVSATKEKEIVSV